MTVSDDWTPQYYWHIQFQSQEKMSFFQNCYWETPAWKCIFRHCCRLISQKGNNTVWLPAKVCFMKIEIQFQCCQPEYIDGIDDTSLDPRVCESPSWDAVAQAMRDGRSVTVCWRNPLRFMISQITNQAVLRINKSFLQSPTQYIFVQMLPLINTHLHLAATALQGRF